MRFIFCSAVIDPGDAARRDLLEFFIEEILEHRGNFKKKIEIEFREGFRHRMSVITVFRSLQLPCGTSI